MNNDVLSGIGYVAQAVADILKDNKYDFTTAWADALKGLGLIGLHKTVAAQMGETVVSTSSLQKPKP